MPHITAWEDNGIYWQFSGELTLQEILDANDEAYGDPRLDNIKYFIWDATLVTNLALPIEEAATPAAIDSAAARYKKILKGALVAQDDSVRAFLQRYIHSSSEFGTTWEFKLFYRIGDARDWVS